MQTGDEGNRLRFLRRLHSQRGAVLSRDATGNASGLPLARRGAFVRNPSHSGRAIVQLRTAHTTLTVPFVLDTLSRTPAMLLNPEDSEFIRDPLKSLGSLFFAMRLSSPDWPKGPERGPFGIPRFLIV